jgi:hypothetical protein
LTTDQTVALGTGQYVAIQVELPDGRRGTA